MLMAPSSLRAKLTPDLTYAVRLPIFLHIPWSVLFYILLYIRLYQVYNTAKSRFEFAVIPASIYTQQNPPSDVREWADCWTHTISSLHCWLHQWFGYEHLYCNTELTPCDLLDLKESVGGHPLVSTCNTYRGLGARFKNLVFPHYPPLVVYTIMFYMIT